MNAKLTLTLASALAASAALLTPTPASACGGFFCSQVPVEQTGEQILFGVDGGTITAQILINYAGEAEDFAWILPVQSVPEITLGTMATFQNLNWRTQPTWMLDWQTEGAECNYWWLYPMAFAEDASAGGRDDDGIANVTVLSQKDVGPFETVVLQSSSTDDLLDWLNEHNYVQPPESRDLIDHYVRQDMVFVALRLLKDEPTGAIQPITLTFEESNPCVPLVLTQIAAMADMPVQLYLVSDHRVVPTNWMHVILNEKKIDWINGGTNYSDVVTQAVDEAAGHGFVTEYAGDSSILKDILYREGQYDLDELARQTTPEAFVMTMLRQGFPRDSQMQNLLRKYIPMPQSLVDEGVTEQQFYNNLGAYTEALEADGFVFDKDGFIAELEERVIAPLRDTQKLLDSKPYLTRLYTTVSSDEMTRDPIFSENPDLPDVSNVHRAKATPTCGEDRNEPPESVLIELENGETMTINGPFEQNWPIISYPDPAPDEPAAERIELLGESGQGTVVHTSQVTAVDQALDTQTPDQVLTDLASGVISPTPVPDDGSDSGSSSGCSQGGLLGGLAAAISALALLFRRKRW